MNSEVRPKTRLEKVGIGIFLVCLIAFVVSMGMSGCAQRAADYEEPDRFELVIRSQDINKGNPDPVMRIKVVRDKVDGTCYGIVQSGDGIANLGPLSCSASKPAK